MHLLGYLQVIPRDPFVFYSHTMVREDVDTMYDNLYNYLVSNEAQSVVAPCQWSSALNYIHHYFKVSYPYMTLDAHGDPHRPTHLEILEEE